MWSFAVGYIPDASHSLLLPNLIIGVGFFVVAVTIAVSITITVSVSVAVATVLSIAAYS